MSAYRCPSCGTSDPLGYVRCTQSSCPDGRDPRPQSDAEVDHLRAQVASLQKELAERTAERDRAKVIISKACNHLPNGAFCSPEASLDFMEHIPDEVLLVTSELVGKVSSAESRADTLARRVEGLTDLAEAVVFHYFNCMDGGGNGCGELRPSMAKLAKEIDYHDPSVDDEIDAALTGERP